MPSPVQLTADGGTINLDIVSGRKLDKFLAKGREEHLCKIWKQKANEKWARGQAEGLERIKIDEFEEIDGDQIRKAGMTFTEGQRRQYSRVLAVNLSTRVLAGKKEP